MPKDLPGIEDSQGCDEQDGGDHDDPTSESASGDPNARDSDLSTTGEESSISSDEQDDDSDGEDSCDDESSGSKDVPTEAVAENVPTEASTTSNAFSLSHALSMVRQKREQEQKAAEERERELAAQRLERSRVKRRRRRQNQKLRKAQAKQEADKITTSDEPEPEPGTSPAREVAEVSGDPADVPSKRKRDQTNEAEAILKRLPVKKRIKLDASKADQQQDQLSESARKSLPSVTNQAQSSTTIVDDRAANKVTEKGPQINRFIPRALLLKRSKEAKQP